MLCMLDELGEFQRLDFFPGEARPGKRDLEIAGELVVPEPILSSRTCPESACPEARCGVSPHWTTVKIKAPSNGR
jgi:hypothetical protein